MDLSGAKNSVLGLLFFSLCLTVFPALANEVPQQQRIITYGKMQPKLMPVAYSGKEKLKYHVSWTGGIKIGELHFDIKSIEGEEGAREIAGLITTEGTFMNTIYPIYDTHNTKVRGEELVPYHYEVWQKEGYGYRAHRVTTYDQHEGRIHYKKNENPVIEYTIEGKVHNEFSAFFASRLMDFEKEKAFLVPTFADKRQVDVEVRTLDYKILEDTVLGTVQTAEVTPILKFKGLYDKRGDTVVWYTNDECRVPVLINSKLAIGSITATLAGYENPACTRYPTVVEKDK